MSEETHRYCTFYLGEQFFGVEVERVQEVLRWQALTRVPLAPSRVRGLVNLRGEIVPAIDIRLALGLEANDDPDSLNVVLLTNEGPVSLLVDRIDDVVELRGEFDLTPDAFSGPAREVISGLYELDDKLLLVLDTAAAIEWSAAPERRAATRGAEGAAETRTPGAAE